MRLLMNGSELIATIVIQLVPDGGFVPDAGAVPGFVGQCP